MDDIETVGFTISSCFTIIDGLDFKGKTERKGSNFSFASSLSGELWLSLYLFIFLFKYNDNVLTHP